MVFLVTVVAERDESMAPRLRQLAQSYGIDVRTRGVGKGAARRARADAHEAALVVVVVTPEGLASRGWQDAKSVVSRPPDDHRPVLVLAARGVDATWPFEDRPRRGWWLPVQFDPEAPDAPGATVDQALRGWGVGPVLRRAASCLATVAHAMLRMGEATLHA